MSIYGTLLGLPSGLPGDPDEPGGRVSAYTGNDPRLVAPGVGGRWTFLDVASIPGFCWPDDVTGGDDTVPSAPWLRLSVGATRPDGGQDAAAVNLDVEAVRSLRDALSAWLADEHLGELDPSAAPVLDAAPGA